MAIAAHSSPHPGEAAGSAREGRTAAARGRHATPQGQGFGYLVGWTIAGTVLPGAGLIAAGRRVIGWLLVAVCVGLAVGTAAFVLSADSPLDAAMSLVGAAVDPTTLLYVAIGIGVVALLWIAVIVASYLALRRHSALSRGQRVGSGLLVVALAVLVAAPAAYAGDLALVQRDLVRSVFSDGDSPDPQAVGQGPQEDEPDPWANMPRVNVLLIGSDAGADRDGVRTDSLILASIDTTTGDTVMFSLPRNLEGAQFPIGTDGAEVWPDGFKCADNACMINAVWQYFSNNPQGAYQDAENPGLQATLDAVSGSLGLPVDSYALVDLEGFQRVVNAMGGITIDVQRDVPIGGGKTLSGRQNPIKGYITAGKNKKLDGYQALWYARSREGSTDYERMGRQRCVIGAIIDKADPLTLVRAYPQLAAAAKEDMSTDIQQADLQAWVELALRVKDGSVRSLPFDDKVVADRANPDYDKIRALVQDALTKPAPTPSPSASTPAPDPTAPATTPPADQPTQAPVDPEQAQDLTAVC